MHSGALVEERFQILEAAGSGGMGVVYRAVDRLTGQVVAVKIMASQRVGDLERFAREISITATLMHPHIVRHIADGGLASGQPYLVMEWLEGEDLAQRLTRGRLNVDESIALVLSVAEALGFAHGRGVVHRDLKPANIFLAGGNINGVKLLDFGIAHITAAARVTQTGMLIGTPEYMAPEQARGDMALDARADVFSLGCVLYECLTGEPAFAGVHCMAILARILFDEPPRVQEKQPNVPAALGALLGRMLAKRAEERPKDGSEVAEALRALEDMVAVTATAPTQEAPRLRMLTASEQRAVAVILLSASSSGEAASLATLETFTDDALRQEVARYGGHLEPLLDGSMAVMVSGTTVATDLAARAARCALALRPHAMDRSIALAMGRGALTGRLPMGQAIDRAAQLIGWLEKEGDGAVQIAVALDEVTAGLLDARFDVRETTAGFALHGERELGEGTRTLLGKATPCVGREGELRMLEQSFGECVEESEARAVIVIAPAGVGKTRLAQEFLRNVKGSCDAIAVWIACGDPLRAGSAFGLLGQLLTRACGIQPGESVTTRRQKLLARVSHCVVKSAQRGVSEFLGEVLGIPFADDSIPLRAARRDAQLMSDQIRAAFLDFLRAELTTTPVLIILENLHWGDIPTVQLLDRALRDLRDRSLFVIAFARPEVDESLPGLWRDRRLSEFRLGELKRKAIERLARYMLGENIERATLDRLSALSEGNAFYLEELIRREAEGRGSDLPETLVAMVQSRLAELDDEARRILRAASVFGEVFWRGSVTALLGGEEGAPRARDILADLIDRDVIVRRSESHFPGEEELAFRHALLREGAYSMLTSDDRVLGHRLAAVWLEQRGESDALVLAEHYERGDDVALAGIFYLRAAEQALHGGHTEVAVTHAHRAIQSGATGELRVSLLALLCEVYAWRRSWSVASNYANEVSRHSAEGSAPWILAAIVKCIHALELGKFDEVPALLSAATVVNPAPDAVPAFAFALSNAVVELVSRGELSLVRATLQRLHEVVEPLAEQEPLARVWMHMPHPRWESWINEDPWQGLQHAEAALAASRAAHHSGAILIARVLVGMNAAFLGSLEQAEHDLRDTLVTDDLHALFMAYVLCTVILSGLLADRGSLDEAHGHATQLIEHALASNRSHEEGHGRWALARVLFRRGEYDSAEQEALICLRLLASSPLDRPTIKATLAAIRLAQGHTLSALASAEEALAEYTALGACSFFYGSFIHLVYAEALHAMGHRVRARESIAIARERLFAIADRIGAPACRASFLECVPENKKTLELARQWLEVDVSR